MEILLLIVVLLNLVLTIFMHDITTLKIVALCAWVICLLYSMTNLIQN